MKYVLTLAILWCVGVALAQPIEKEHLSKMKSTFWDFNKTQLQSRGKYYVDEFGLETTEKHGKWEYFNRYGELEEVRNYYRDMLSGEVVAFFANGKKKQQGFFKYDRQDSLYFEWYETGNLQVEGYYVNDVPQGKWRYYYRDGALKSVEETIGDQNFIREFYLPDSLHTQTITNGNGELATYYTSGLLKEWYNYKDGLKHGPFEERSTYGYVTLRGAFANGEKDSTWEYFYYTGDKEKVSTYKNGVLNGPYTYYYDNSQVNVEGHYKNGEKSGEWTWYTNKGTRDMQGEFKNNLQHGDWTYWYPTGELSYTAKFTDGLRTGQWTYYYKNGQKFKEGTFAKDEKNGNWKTWYEDGTLLMDGNYVDGKEDGEWLNYWESGKLKNKGNFRKGLLHGDWESYYPGGRIHLTGSYDEAMKTGEWTEYFENGHIKTIENYKLFKKKSKLDYTPLYKDHVILESKLHGHFEAYSAKDYKKTEEGAYKEGVKDGQWTAYHPGGRLPAVTTEYKDGELNGVMKTYDRRGNLLQEAEYKDGVKHGKFLIYDKRGKVIKEMKFNEGIQVVEGTSSGSGGFTPGR